MFSINGGVMVILIVKMDKMKLIAILATAIAGISASKLRVTGHGIEYTHGGYGQCFINFQTANAH